MKSGEWSNELAIKLYTALAKKKVYVTNLARCTQPDARHVPNMVFQESLPVTFREIAVVRPKVIISFGNQVSSNLLQQPIFVSKWRGKKENLHIGKNAFPVYPVYYPVGMGMQNMPKAVADIKKIMKAI